MLSIRARLIRMLVKHWVGPKFVQADTVEEQRHFAEQFSKHNRLPADTTVSSVTINDISAEWIAVGESPPNKVLIYFHGGGYVIGSINTHREIAARIAQACGVKVLLVDYRLAPEHVYPAAIEDAVTVYQWLLEQGYLPQHIAMAGDSAGGGLTMATLVTLRDQQVPLPQAAICISPWVDLEVVGDSVALNADIDPYVKESVTKKMGLLYAGGQDLRTPTLSPIYADLTDLPPLLIHVGTHEILLDDAKRLYQQAIACGVDANISVREGMFHVWHTFAGIMPEAKQAVDEIGQFVQFHLNQ